MNSPAYLDHNATTAIRPEAMAAAGDAFRVVGNASSIHRAGREARRLIEEAREKLARLLSVSPAAIVFTSGGTEANAQALTCHGRKRVLVSAVEHPSVLKAVGYAESVPVDAEGVIVLDALEDMLAGDARPALLAIMLANNETGVIQPVAEAAAIARRLGARVHCDAVQALGKIEVAPEKLGVHSLSLSAHKMGGPPGIGALVLTDGDEVLSMIRGGGQESGHRAGTENLPGIAGFGAAAEVLARDGCMDAGLRDRLETAMREIAPEVGFIGSGADRLPNTSMMLTPGVKGSTQVMALDLEGVMVSAGSACSSGKVASSHVLAAMGLEPDNAACAIRVSFGWNSRVEDLERFLLSWKVMRDGTR